MQLNSQSCETKSDATFLTLSLLWVLFSEIEMVGYLADDDFYQRFAEADSSLLEYISRSLTKIETISDDRGIFFLQDFLDLYPWGGWKTIYKLPLSPQPFSALNREIFSRLGKRVQRLLTGEHEQPEIAYNVEAVDDDGFDTADSGWWSFDAKPPYRVTLPGKYDVNSQLWLPILTDEYLIVTPGWERANTARDKSNSIKLLEINSYSDWVLLCKHFPLVKSAPFPLNDINGAPQRWITADLDSARNTYDAIKLSIRGYFDAAYRLQDQIDGIPCLLMGWNPGATIWLRPSVSEVRESWCLMSI